MDLRVAKTDPVTRPSEYMHWTVMNRALSMTLNLRIGGRPRPPRPDAQWWVERILLLCPSASRVRAF